MQDVSARAIDSHYEATFRLAGSGLARVDLSGRFVDVNPHLCDLLGYSREQLLVNRFQDITHPDDIANSCWLLKRAIEGEVDSYRLEKRYIRSGGDLLWADLTVAVEKDPDGRLTGFISTISDIRSFKQTEERMSFLVEELAHRSRNVLGIVLSMVNQTRAATVDDFRRHVRQRIRALAASQDLILGRDADKTCFDDLVAEALRAFVPPGDLRAGYIGPNIELGPHAVRILGMALHELATNACKYGALSTPSGQVVIRCEVDDSRPEWVTIRWIELGGPTVRRPMGSGFGRKVVEDMVSHDLDADVVLRFHPQGVEWKCRVALEDLRR